MPDTLLRITEFTVFGDQIPPVRISDLAINSGETVLITGDAEELAAIGAALMGSTAYRTEGSLLLDETELGGMSSGERFRAGLFLAHHEPPVIMGLKLEDMLKGACARRGNLEQDPDAFAGRMIDMMHRISMHPAYGGRDLNEGLTAGDRKRCEVLQLLMTVPRIAVLDRTFDDEDAEMTGASADGIRCYMEEMGGTLLILSESGRLPEGIGADRSYVLEDGELTPAAAEEQCDG